MKPLLAILLTSSILFAQSDSVYKYTFPEFKISQLENGKDVTYGFAEERNVMLVHDSMLIGDPERYKYQVPIGNIRKLSILDGNYGWRGAKVMGLVGGELGVLMGGMFVTAYGGITDKTGLIIAVPAFLLTGILAGGLVGGILGSAIPYYEEYSRFSDNTRAKKEILKRIFKKHNLR